MRPIQLAIKLVFLLIVLVSCEQKRKYWIYFNQSENSSLVKNELFSDSKNSERIFIPKDGLNISVDFYSNWLHAGTAWLSKSELVALSDLDDIKEILPVSDLKLIPNTLNIQDTQLSFALEQIKGEYFIEKGLSGEGVKIGIIDGGFLDANNKIALSHIFKNNGIRSYKDYLTPEMRQYGGSKGADDGHGTDVWTQIAGMHPERKVQFGLATAAEFYLARTDDGRKENRTEEEYLIQALEWMDSQGVKLVNISLGYSTGYDNPDENYLPKHVDGKFTAVTRAVNVASEQKGMLIIVSAGNDGQNDFKVLSVPADAKGVLTVGATNFKTWDKASYSSIGPKKLDFMKPNVACFAFNGTSFSAPVITGLAACIMQLDSSLSNNEVISIIERSSHLFPYGNNYVGYGVPSCKKIYDAITNETLHQVADSQQNFIRSQKNRINVKMPVEEGTAIIFHKSDIRTVCVQTKMNFSDFNLLILKPQNTKYSTLTFGDFVREIKWN